MDFNGKKADIFGILWKARREDCLFIFINYCDRLSNF
jgi:hypothetical protein